MPAKAFEDAVTAMVTEVVPVMVGEEKLTVMPVGAPPADRETAELNPSCALIVRITVFGLPGETVRLEGFEASV